MTRRPHRHSDGKYHIKCKKFPELFGSRVQVWNGTAYKTPGGLTKPRLTMNKHHRIVSLKKHNSSKKEKRLEKYGYFAKKGKFGYVKKTPRKKGGGTDGTDNSLPPSDTSSVTPSETSSVSPSDTSSVSPSDTSSVSPSDTSSVTPSDTETPSGTNGGSRRKQRKTHKKNKHVK